MSLGILFGRELLQISRCPWLADSIIEMTGEDVVECCCDTLGSKGGNACDLLSRMLVMNPESRIRSDQVLVHKYFSNGVMT